LQNPKREFNSSSAPSASILAEPLENFFEQLKRVVRPLSPFFV